MIQRALFQTDDEIKTKGGHASVKGYEQYFVSYLYKTTRIGDTKAACLAAEVIRYISGDYRIALILNQLVGEDLHPTFYAKVFPLVTAHLPLIKDKIIKKHNLWQQTYILTKSPKWYMDKAVQKIKRFDGIYNGEELEKIRQYINVEVTIDDDFIKSFKFPEWVYDRHTSIGMAKFKRGTSSAANLILDGKWDNRFNIKAKFDEIFDKVTNNGDKKVSYDKILNEWIGYIRG